jgi:pyruvate kinase
MSEIRKAKIVCTIGPSSSSPEVLAKMIKADMNMARFNFSHGTHREHGRAAAAVRRVSRKLGRPVALMMDMKGLKIRLGEMKNGGVRIEPGSRVLITNRKLTGDERVIPVLYAGLSRDLRKGDRILIDDGLIELEVLRQVDKGIESRVLEGGIIRSHKGVNFPGVRISAPTFTGEDRAALEFAVREEFDYVAISFVRSRVDIRRVRRFLKRLGSSMPLIAKIENRESIGNIDEIIHEADGIMIARGDLGVEMPPEEVPLLQKELISKCNKALKPVITATQMLESMTVHMRPTRAEAADVANAVLDGTDALMLSAETSVGSYPVKAVEMMDRIIRTAEQKMKGRDKHITSGDIGFAQALGDAACHAAEDTGACSIVAFTRSGFTALMVSKNRPHTPVIGFTTTEAVRRRMCLFWGVSPHIMEFPENTDDMILEADAAIRRLGLARRGDSIVIIASSPFPSGENTNIMKLHRVGY